MGPREVEDSIRRADLHRRAVHRRREARHRSPVIAEERPYTSARVRRSPEPEGWDGPDGRVSLVLFVPPARGRGWRDLDVDSALRVRPWRDAPHLWHASRGAP